VGGKAARPAGGSANRRGARGGVPVRVGEAEVAEAEVEGEEGARRTP